MIKPINPSEILLLSDPPLIYIGILGAIKRKKRKAAKPI